jgi:acyl carrier protein
MHTRQSILAAIATFCEPRKLLPTRNTVLQDHGFDSLDLVELSMFLEDRYGISIDDSIAPKWTTVDSVIDTVLAALPAHQVDAVDAENEYERTKDNPYPWMLSKDDVAEMERQYPPTGVAMGTTWMPTPEGGHPILMSNGRNLQSAIHDILTEFHSATSHFPQWPTDPLHALAVVQEEVGEVQKEVLQLTYEPHKSDREKVRKEAIQMAAMSLRFLLSLDAYAYAPGAQHEQNQ